MRKKLYYNLTNKQRIHAGINLILISTGWFFDNYLKLIFLVTASISMLFFLKSQNYLPKLEKYISIIICVASILGAFFVLIKYKHLFG